MEWYSDCIIERRKQELSDEGRERNDACIAKQASFKKLDECVSPCIGLIHCFLGRTEENRSAVVSFGDIPMSTSVSFNVDTVDLC